jgi:hypothetical protein
LNEGAVVAAGMAELQHKEMMKQRGDWMGRKRWRPEIAGGKRALQKMAPASVSGHRL